MYEIHGDGRSTVVRFYKPLPLLETLTFLLLRDWSKGVSL